MAEQETNGMAEGADELLADSAEEAWDLEVDEDPAAEYAGDAAEELEPEQEGVEPEEDSEDSLTYANGVIEKIVAMATREVPHILGMKGNFFHTIQEQFMGEVLTKGVTVDVTEDNRVIVNISVIIEYGCYAPAIFEDVKARVTERLASITGLEVAGINLRIENVVTREEAARTRRHRGDGAKAVPEHADEQLALEGDIAVDEPGEA